jgi:hypothetical protein
MYLGIGFCYVFDIGSVLCALIVNWGAYMVGYRTVLLLLP